MKVAEDLEDEEEMVSPSQIAMQLVDWTDPRRLVDLSKTNMDLETLEEETTMRNRNIHVDLAILIMQQMKKGSSANPNLIYMADIVCRRGKEGVVQYVREIVYYCKCRCGET